jgi:hypothetical protein
MVLSPGCSLIACTTTLQPARPLDSAGLSTVEWATSASHLSMANFWNDILFLAVLFPAVPLCALFAALLAPPLLIPSPRLRPPLKSYSKSLLSKSTQPHILLRHPFTGRVAWSRVTRPTKVLLPSFSFSLPIRPFCPCKLDTVAKKSMQYDC